MTSTIAPRRNTATTTNTTSSTPSSAPAAGVSTPDDGVEDIDSMRTAPADTMAPPAPKARYAAFNPPAPPALLDESKAGDVQAARKENGARIEAYNTAYGEYVERYEEAVKNEAVTNEMLRRIGPPVEYSPMGNLPVKQRARYDHLVDAHLDTKIALNEELGARKLEEKGIKAPGSVSAVADIRATALGNGVRLKGDTAEGAELMHGEGFTNGLLHGAGSQSAGELLAEAAEKAEGGAGEAAKNLVDVGVTHWSTMDGEKSETSYSVKVGPEEGVYGGAEVEGKTLTLESGVRFGIKKVADGSLGVWNATDGDSVAAGVKGSAAFGHVELEAYFGVNMALVSTEAAKEAIEGDGFFDEQRVLANRSGSGR